MNTRIMIRKPWASFELNYLATKNQAGNPALGHNPELSRPILDDEPRPKVFDSIKSSETAIPKLNYAAGIARLSLFDSPNC